MSKWILDEADVENVLKERIKTLKQYRSFNRNIGCYDMASADTMLIDEDSVLFQKIRNEANIVADAVEVVRCKNCKYFGELIFGYGPTCNLYPPIGIPTYNEDYCSKAERREDNA